MAKTTSPIPQGYHTITPYLICRRASEALTFYEKALGAKVLFKMDQPDGRIGHAELQIGSSRLMLADEFPERNIRGPESIGGSPVMLHLYVEDVDSFFARAIEAGGKVERPVTDQFYGDRSGGFRDPFGHSWYVATHKEDVPPEEMERRQKQQGEH